MQSSSGGYSPHWLLGELCTPLESYWADDISRLALEFHPPFARTQSK